MNWIVTSLRLPAALVVLIGFAASALAQSNVLRVEVPPLFVAGAGTNASDLAVRNFAQRLSSLTQRNRETLSRVGRYNTNIPFSMPTVVQLTVNGVPLPPALTGRTGRKTLDPQGNSITLAFDPSGSTAFLPSYKQLLIDTFTTAQATMNLVFGTPAASGTVFVRNFDATIGDRDAIAGGYFVANNGSGQAEIRFPVYSSPEATAVNFVHCLCLAYLGGSSYSFDAFQEGIVRAATMRIVRTPGALPAFLDAEKVEETLENTYDVGNFYDWYNQRALSGQRFIAPNLRDVPLPIGGSLGGIYLLRYQMAGSAWQKALVEFPGFAAQFNQAFYADPSIAGNIPALLALGQNVIDTLNGGPNATIEGLSFAQWYRRQFILQTQDLVGQKLLLQPLPLFADGGTSDFGVYLVQATWFETLANGNEILSSGVSYPIFWTDVYDRLFPSAQDERMDIGGAYGSLAPNFSNLYAGQPYRVAVDVPVQDKMARVYVPSGAFSTGSNPSPRNFYGTVLGVPTGAGVSIRVRVTIGATVIDNIPVTHGAFGFTISAAQFLGSARCRIEVISTVSGLDTVVIDRRVNKGPGALAVDLRTGNGESLFTTGLPGGLSSFGFPVDPLDNLPSTVLGIPENDVLAARWNGGKGKYDIYPDGGGFIGRNGYFARMAAPVGALNVLGRNHPGTSVAVALRPGWNMITTPINEVVPTSRVRVVVAADSPLAFADAIGPVLSPDFFTFSPGAPDAASGFPETGSMTAATNFQPGKMYFIRVLAAEGASLLFTPATPLLPGSAQLSAVPVPSPSNWGLRVTLTDWYRESSVIVGGSATATSSFDPKEDTAFPPAFSQGMQVAVEGGLYRDTRKAPAPQVYKINLTGLKKNQRYWVRINPETGKLKRYIFRDLDTPSYRSVTGSFEYTFTTSKTEKTIVIIVDNNSF
ncbi:MAG: hypothetical protein KF784_12345 [Fimbriimonadaceae bacterium]|nr:hypothetical protein [Fimbriimonadaceae bacterium]